MALSSKSLGTPSMTVLTFQIAKGRFIMVLARINGIYVLYNPAFTAMTYSAIAKSRAGNVRRLTRKLRRNSRPLKKYLEKPYAASSDSIMVINVAPTATTSELKNGRSIFALRNIFA